MKDKSKLYLTVILLAVLVTTSLAEEQAYEDGQKAKREIQRAKTQRQKRIEEAKMWALGCSAVLAERNHKRHDLLGYYLLPGKREIEKSKQLLDEWWGINSRADLFDSLLRLRIGGHREKFNRWGEYIENLSEQEYQELLEKNKGDEEKLQEIKIAKKYYKELGEKSILGWDYSRYICLCRWGYLVGYITEEEAWKMIMEVAGILQKTFDSWEDLGQNYIIGRQFWSYKYTKEGGYLYEDAYQRLLDMPSSPWNKYPWDMDLTDTATVGEPDETDVVEQNSNN